jgi:predicted nuclease of predicted toxin-antitoxin system
MKIIVDMNLSPRWAQVLNDAGFDSTHWSSIGDSHAPDTQIMAYAKLHNGVVLTHDLDFGTILAANKHEKPSVVQIRSDDLRPEHIGHSVIMALHQFAAELETGALITVNPTRTRASLLPLGKR